MNYKTEYNRWMRRVVNHDLVDELTNMSEAQIEDAFYGNLIFGTGGLRGILGAGTNRMNIYVVAKVSQGLANYLGTGRSVVIGYDSRIKSDMFAEVAAGVFVANGINTWMWPELLPVSMVSYAVRKLGASAGVMITASHNPGRYNGYKVYGDDGCQITIEAANKIANQINLLDIFTDVHTSDFEEGVKAGKIKYIKPSVLTDFIEEVKAQSVQFGDYIDHNITIVYSPLNGTGLKPVTRVLKESGFTNITVVKEQQEPDGNFPTCPLPNPEIREVMELGLKYCRRINADLLLATDPDCDRCGIAVKAGDEYRLLTGNEVGLLILDYICLQRQRHGKMPNHPVFIKTIVTTDIAEKIASHYGVETINVLTGFKFIGEMIGRLEAQGREEDYICGFEESYGYLTGSYIRDKDAVNAVFIICEMFAFYKARDVSLIDKLEEIYNTYGYCLNTLHFYEFSGSSGRQKMVEIMSAFHKGFETIGGKKVVKTEDYSQGLNGLPKADVLKYYFQGGKEEGSVVIRPSGTELKIKLYVSITTEERALAEIVERKIMEDLEKQLRQRLTSAEFLCS